MILGEHGVNIFSPCDSDFMNRFGAGLGCVVSLLNPDNLDSAATSATAGNRGLYMLANSHIIISSVSAFESLTRKWKATKNNANQPPVSLFIFHNLHLVDNPAYGSLYEAIVFRVRQFYSCLFFFFHMKLFDYFF
jgi:hypothetical protein